ncbi:MAG: IgGFc-binding protein [Myxococcales bacterium]|nr:IgGFc-binding protein [Myxococcales bacterium]MCB9580513.1 IgGFc-binding protein [Polyangiaceae bacterium]
MQKLSSVALFGLALAASCSFDRGDRWLVQEVKPPPPLCTVGDQRCSGGLQECQKLGGKLTWVTLDDCKAQGLVCVPGLFQCKTCVPNAGSCDGQTTQQCDANGDVITPGKTCDPTTGSACRSGSCIDLCSQALQQRSNVGCEYWAVDLDNANVSASLNAAAQQFAVVVSNPQPDVTAKVSIEQDDSLPGDANAPFEVANASIPPLSLRVFKLGPREVDGSPEGSYDHGTHTALTRHAYRLTSDFPVVAYQFNPLENVNVFSNDASLLKPVEALGGASGAVVPSYVVLGWPQTIASTDDPKTNFNPNDPTDLRAFLTIVGTRPNTTVRVKSSTGIIAGGPVQTTLPGGDVEVSLGPFDVLNLETDDFNADFTGSLVSADQPVVVFSGSEASDAPFFSELSLRRCCADHLEEQLDPLRTAGKRFVASVSANRTRAVQAAGATIGVIDQPEYFRVIAATEAGARITTTLPGKDGNIVLSGRGDFANITSIHDFMLESDAPIMLSSVSPSQEAAGIPRGLPGGDPSLLIIPPIEQFRSSYVFLTPDKYSFDFIRIVSPPGATIVLDGQDISTLDSCVSAPGDGLTEAERGSAVPPFIVHRCQLSFPVIDPDKTDDNLSPGFQDDGVHRIDSDAKIGVLVDGFDAYVSYAYAAGTELTQIVPE